MPASRWTTRDGRELRPQDFEDEHLLNAHRLSQERVRDNVEGKVTRAKNWLPVLAEEIGRRELNPLSMRVRPTW